MKRIFYLSLVLPLFLFSCESIPEAHFIADMDKPGVGQSVSFTNASQNASKFEWDFGDGYTSNEENPIHVYKGTGPVEVTLTAISKSGLSDKASLTLEVMIPTLLEIEVREFYDEYIVPQADVYLYFSITDLDLHNDNYISVGKTDVNGLVVFSDLDPFVYYIDVYEKKHDNQKLRNEDIEFVRTSEILPNQINKFIAWVDFYAKGKGMGVNSMVIRKLERKPSDKRQPVTESGTQDWQKVYNRRIVK